MKGRPTILFLYSELAEYFLACIRKLSELYEVDIHIVHWPLNEQAPFQFNIPADITAYSKDELTAGRLQELVANINPDLVFSCGWMDDDYVTICKKFKKEKIPVIAGIDNHWEGTMRQYLARLISRFTIKKYYSHIWVAGKPQKEYAQKLGFDDGKILSGYYSADVDFFNSLYRQKKEESNYKVNRRFIYVGRYLQRKGLFDLWEAFIRLNNEHNTSWELWCLGTGPLQDQAVQHPKINHVGFVQPRDMPKYINETDVFILPSHHEPWGVVVHEFAAAGFPLICSDGVGAASAFLEDGKNGFLFESGSVDALKNAMLNICKSTPAEIQKMSEISAQRAQNITPASWSKTLMGVL